MQRLYAKSDVGVASVLNTYWQQVQMCQSISPSMLGSVSEEGLERALTMLERDAVEIPLNLQEALLRRRVNSMLALKPMRWRPFLEVINPWATSERFSALLPTLGSLESKSRLATWTKTLFTDQMVPMLFLGDASQAEVRDLCMTCLSVYRDLDMLEKTAAEAAAHEQACCIWRAVLSLCDHSLDDENQDQHM